MRVIVAGSRNFNDYSFLKNKLDIILSNSSDVEIVSGNARGADCLGELYAKEKGYSLKLFPADWDTLGKRAGYVRNKQMAEYATHCVVFWDGISKGSKHMIDLAEQYGLGLRVVRY